MKPIYVAISILALSLGSCVQTPDSSTYSRAQMGRAATVMKGKILAIREVKISGESSGVGATAGAGSGAVAGSYLGGSSRGNILGAIGGAVVGGVAGSIAEQSLSASGAFEYIVQQENGQIIAIVQANSENLKVGNPVLILRSDRVRLIPDSIPPE